MLDPRERASIALGRARSGNRVVYLVHNEQEGVDTGRYTTSPILRTILRKAELSWSASHTHTKLNQQTQANTGPEAANALATESSRNSRTSAGTQVLLIRYTVDKTVLKKTAR